MQQHALIEWDEGWYSLIFAFGLGVVLLALLAGGYGLYRLKQRLERHRT